MREGILEGDRAEKPNLLKKRTYDIKPQIEVAGEILYPELALVRLAQKVGWEAAWMDSFHYGVWRDMPTTQRVQIPDQQVELLDRITSQERTKDGRTRWAGCWDVVAWREDEVAFIESKGTEELEGSQLRFLESALTIGVPLEAFSLAVWELSGESPAGISSPQRAPSVRANRARRDWKVPNNHTLPAVPLEVRQMVGDLSPCQVLAIVNPSWISRERPSRLRSGIKVQGQLVMTPGEGVKDQSKRTRYGDTVAAAIRPLLPDEYSGPPESVG